jgi:hypothetical protein
MEKSEIIKIIIQYLNDKGFKDVGLKLEDESRVNYESKYLKKLKSLIKENKFEESVKLILQNCPDNNDKILIIPKIRLVQIFENSLKNLKENKQKETIELIRQICNSNSDYEKNSAIEKCSSLIFINKKTELMKKIKEISPTVYSKETLIE